MKKFGKLLTVLLMATMVVSLFAGCGATESDPSSASKEIVEPAQEVVEPAPAKEVTEPENVEPEVTDSAASNSAEFVAFPMYIGRWSDVADDVSYVFQEDGTWYMETYSTNEWCAQGTFNYYDNYIELLDEENTRILTNMVYNDNTLVDDFGIVYEADTSAGTGENDEDYPVIPSGVYYLNEDLSAEEYLRIDGADYYFYRREAGVEPYIVDSGYYSPEDYVGHFLAYSTDDPDTVYEFFMFDEGVLIIDNAGRYVFME